MNLIYEVKEMERAKTRAKIERKVKYDKIKRFKKEEMADKKSKARSQEKCRKVWYNTEEKQES